MGRGACALLVLLGLGITPVLAAAEKAAAPTVAITSPEPGITVASDSVEVTAAYAALEGSAIAKVELIVDTMVVATSQLDPAEENGQVTLTWEATGYLDGRHQVVMRVTDTAGRTAKSTITTSLQRGLPSERPPVRVSAPRRNATVSGVVDFTLEAEDPAQVKYVIFLVDNVFKAMSNIRPFSYGWDTTSYLNGLHRLQARAYLSDGSDRLSSLIEVRVDNPSGATALKAPAPVAAPKPAAEPAHAADTPLPPARTTATPTPYGAPQQVESTEIGAPGTAPYISPTGDIVQPPTTVLAERTPAGSELKVAMVAEAAGEASTPKAASRTAVSAPPAPRPVVVAAAPAVTPSSAPAMTTAAPAASAPVQVAALPAPGSAPARTEAARELPPLGAAVSPSLEMSQPAAQATARPAPAPAVAVTATAPLAQPAMVAAAAEPAASPAPVAVALLPAEPVVQTPEPKLTAEVKPQLVASVMVNGEPLAGGYPKLTVTDEKGGQMHLLPLRAVVEQLHGIVLWEHETKQATVDARGNHVIVTIQHIEALVNGKTVHMEVSPVVVEGRTLVQARFLAKALNLSLNFQDGVLELAAN